MNSSTKIGGEYFCRVIAVLFLLYVIEGQILRPAKEEAVNDLEHPSNFFGGYVVGVGTPTASMISMISFSILPS